MILKVQTPSYTIRLESIQDAINEVMKNKRGERAIYLLSDSGTYLGVIAKWKGKELVAIHKNIEGNDELNNIIDYINNNK